MNGWGNTNITNSSSSIFTYTHTHTHTQHIYNKPARTILHQDHPVSPYQRY